MNNGEREELQETGEIDYLHPDGKPAVSASQAREDKEERGRPVNQKSLDEVDGHHMCNDSCKTKHEHASK